MLTKEEIYNFLMSNKETGSPAKDWGLGFMSEKHREFLKMRGAIKTIILKDKSLIDVVARDYPVGVVYQESGNEYVDCNGNIEEIKEKLRQIRQKKLAGSLGIEYVPKGYGVYIEVLMEIAEQESRQETKKDLVKEINNQSLFETEPWYS